MEHLSFGPFCKEVVKVRRDGGRVKAEESKKAAIPRFRTCRMPQRHTIASTHQAL